METFLADLDKFPLRRLTLCGVPYDGLWHLKHRRGGNSSVEAFQYPQGSPPSAAIAMMTRMCVEDITCPLGRMARRLHPISMRSASPIEGFMQTRQTAFQLFILVVLIVISTATSISNLVHAKMAATSHTWNRPAAGYSTVGTALSATPRDKRAPVGHSDPAPRLLNNGEFALFLRKLDTGVLAWKAQLKSHDVKSLGFSVQESEELERSYNLCLQSLDNTREEIEKLLQKQTLKLDFLLLVDLNDLGRNLDGLDRDLASTMTDGRNAAAQKSLRYAREVLSIDVALAPYNAGFQHHVLAFAGVIDATLDEADQDSDQSPAQN
jgi:hypothetical protein